MAAVIANDASVLGFAMPTVIADAAPISAFAVVTGVKTEPAFLNTVAVRARVTDAAEVG